MSVLLAEFGIRSPDLTLTEAFESVPGAAFDLVTETATDPEQPVLFFWASADDLAELEAAMAADQTVTDVEQYASGDGRRLYRARLSESVDLVLYPLWVELGVDLVHVHFDDGWWHFRVGLPERTHVGRLSEWFEAHGVEFELHSVVDAPETEERSLLTPAQSEALELALGEGYYEVPRGATLADLAGTLDVSGQAVSERLRRGTAALLADHFSTEPPSSE
jgi:predicted DNA binding protein